MSIKTDALIIRDETVDGANTALRIGQTLSDIADDLIAKQSAIDLNNAKETNVDHPLVETAVPIGAVFTDTVYNDASIQAAVALNTLKESNIAHPLVEKAVPSDAVFTDTDTIYDDANVLKDSDTLSPVTGANKLMTQDDVAGLGGGDMLASTYDPIIDANTAKVGITTQQASDITANNDKISYTDAAAVAANTAKETNIAHPLVETAVPVGAVFTDTIYDDTDIQAEVALNTEKVGVTAQMVSDINTNNLKVGITTQQADDIVANNAKVTYPSADSTKLGLIEAEATKDTTATIQTKRPLKTVNGESLEGSGNIVVSGGGGGNTSVTVGTGAAIDVTNVVGAYYNIGASSTATEFTVPTVAVGGFAVVQSASTTTEPTVTVTGGTATEVPSLAWTASALMYLNIYSYDGTNVFYYWSDTISTTDLFTATTISDANANAGLTGTEEVLVNNSGVLEKTTTQDIADLGGGGGVLSQTAFVITNPVISGGTTGQLEMLPSPGVGKAYIIDSVNTFTTIPVIGTGSGNPSISFHYSGDGGSITNGIPFLISGSGSNTIWSSSAGGNRYIDIDNRAINYQITHGTDQTFIGEVTVWCRYAIVDI